MSHALRITITGAVQGVGFRPHVYRLATQYGVMGWVANGPEGVVIEAQGEGCQAFARELEAHPPTLARVRSFERQAIEPSASVHGFRIVTSSEVGPAAVELLPDLAICGDCVGELLDPSNRRYRYPFINCTQCGPRYSIIESLPYDRERTTMRHFPMCEACRAELEDPADRRFHAQPIACAQCGPQLEPGALEAAARALELGHIAALKGLGGYQLAVDARNRAAVQRLRARKGRPDKPLAVMVADREAALSLCAMSEAEARAFEAPSAPIVVMRALPDNGIASTVAPDLPWLGVMRATTPLHHLLLDALGGIPLVMTSGNRSGEVLCIEREEAHARLHAIADVFVDHDRPIAHPVDDSVVRVIAGQITVLRAARGLAPCVVEAEVAGGTLAVGGHLKSAVAVTTPGKITLGPYIGQLDTESTQAAFERNIEHLSSVLGVEVSRVACDRHPDYASTAWAERMEQPLIRVQHHHAHVLACMAEHRLTGPVLGVAWDGTGWGGDGTVWGGEFLRVDARGFERVGHLPPFPLPGGEQAIREPRRSALGWLYATRGEAAFEVLADAFSQQEMRVLESMLKRGVSCPMTTSAGRRFDAESFLLGVAPAVQSYEGQAAMLLEASELPAAQAFHERLAERIVEEAQREGLHDVVLSGGCFLNARLTALAIRGLEAAGHQVWRHLRLTPGDGALAVGQAWLYRP